MIVLDLLAQEDLLLLAGDCREVMQTLGAESIDSVVTDPPYELDFMGKGWDRTGVAFDIRVWSNAFRLAKPGAHLLAFGGTRTYHRMACAIEDAGWEIRDSIDWIYGQGFPKSHNLEGEHEGKGTALKPAHEPIVLARKPLDGTVAENVAIYGTGALNIEAARVPASSPVTINRFEDGAKPFGGGAGHPYQRVSSVGRWPSNIILTHAAACRKVGTKKVKNTAGSLTGLEPSNPTKNVYGHAMRREWTKHGDADGMETIDVFECVEGCPVREIDLQSGRLETHGGPVAEEHSALGYSGGALGSSRAVAADAGGASRFFHRFEWDDFAADAYAAQFVFCPKASRSEREGGLEHMPAEIVNDGRQTSIDNPYQRGDTLRKNTHPTVKPLALMRHLVRLVTPRGGSVLDPFAGSGTTLLAAHDEHVRCYGIELKEAHAVIARERILSATRQLDLFGAAP